MKGTTARTDGWISIFYLDKKELEFTPRGREKDIAGLLKYVLSIHPVGVLGKFCREQLVSSMDR